jgi:membrane protease YdiL (CAAX protease family)
MCEPESGIATGYGARWLSLIEFLIGGGLVIGHNVLRVLPNEVPLLFALALISTRVRRQSWRSLGFRVPKSWRQILLMAAAAAALRIILGEFVIDPIATQFWPPAAAPQGTEAITGHLANALLALVFVWSFAAMGEEIGYRGYLLTRGAEAAGGSPKAYWAVMLVVSILFGIGHFYKGPTGIVDSGIAGFILGSAYLLAGRNLSVSILAHGLIDTYAVIVVFLGWQS